MNSIEAKMLCGLTPSAQQLLSLWIHFVHS